MDNIDYAWTVYNLTVVPEMNVAESQTPFKNVVTHIWWILKAELDGHVVDTNGVEQLPSPSMPFHEFEMLTKEEVMNWLMQLLGPRVEGLKDALRRRLNDMINPPVMFKLPPSWSSEPSSSQTTE
jgi:hypothetical protein